MKITFRTIGNKFFTVETNGRETVFTNQAEVDWIKYNKPLDTLCVTLSKMPEEILQDVSGAFWIDSCDVTDKKVVWSKT